MSSNWFIGFLGGNSFYTENIIERQLVLINKSKSLLEQISEALDFGLFKNLPIYGLFLLSAIFPLTCPSDILSPRERKVLHEITTYVNYNFLTTTWFFERQLNSLRPPRQQFCKLKKSILCRMLSMRLKPIFIFDYSIGSLKSVWHNCRVY